MEVSRATGIPAHAYDEANFRDLIRHNADAILIVRLDGTVCFANPAAEALFGRAARQLVGSNFGTPIVPGATAEIDVLRGSDLSTAELRAVNVVWDGAPAHLASLRDMTERKRNEDSLRLLAELTRVLVGSLDLTGMLEQTARLLVAHVADYCLIDLLAEDGLLRAAATAHARPDAEMRLRERRQSRAQAEDLTTWFRELAAGRVARLCPSLGEPGAAAPPVPREFGFRSSVCQPLVVRERPLGLLTLVVTEPGRRFHDRTLWLLEEVAARVALAVESAQLYAASREALRRRDEFLAMLAHELRNPLAAMQSAAGVLDQTARDGRAADAAGVVARQCRQMARLLDDLLDVARVTHGKIELRRQSLDFKDCVVRALEVCRPRLEARRHGLTVALAPRPLWVDADPARLEQILVNLLQNAAKYTEPGGRIEVTASTLGNEVVCSVKDNGRGIAPELLGRIFDLFTQAEPADREQGGLGIGLTLVRDLTRLHGGCVSAHSPGPGQGSEFVIRLPRAAAPETPTLPASLVMASASKRILLVEDEDDSRRMLRELLELWGHRVDEATDGEEAVRKALAGDFELALIDIHLPKCDGHQVARRLRAAPERSTLRLVALTGFGQAEDRRKAVRAGFDAHLVKPVDLQELAQLIASAPARS